MQICLSSGSSEQYRRDILRALALPTGAVLQFRYQDKYVDDRILRVLERGSSPNSDVLIAYIDQSDPSSAKEPQLLPCRFATLKSANRYGRALVLSLELRDFCRTGAKASPASQVPDALEAGADAFNRSLVGTARPVWVDGKASGKYWFEIPDSDAISRSKDLTDFEDTVRQLVSHTEFASEPLFYHINAVRSISGRPAGEREASHSNWRARPQVVQPQNGEFLLEANRNYEFEVFHFHPTRADDSRLLFQSGTPSLAITGNSILYFSSRYDLKRVVFRVSNPPSSPGEFPVLNAEDPSATELTGSIVSVFRMKPSSKFDDKEWDFDLPVRIKPDLGSVMTYGTVLGVALAAPSAATLLATGRGDLFSRLLGVGFIVLAGIGLGIFAALGLRKPTP
jgi:hypothetical protein